ncbi:MAG TPA: hypothetical protein VFO75_04665 [Candidatus Dormibacteraeota bacterium]|nr:hypothetical protein [Candidatus Dormibacteraeota bacterium]
MDFKVDLVGRRERRALLLVAAALVTVVGASITYLRPPATPRSAPIVAAAAPSIGQYDPIAFTVVPGTGRPTGAYFVWRVGVPEPGGSGGHRAG